MTPRQFSFRFDRRFLAPLALAGVTPVTTGIEVTDELRVRFGPWSLRTPLTNVVSVEVQGPHRWWRAVGPRLSFADRGVTFGTNAQRTVCVDLAEPVRVLDPTGRLRHPNVSISAADCEALAAALRPAA